MRPEGSPTEAVALPTWLFGFSMRVIGEFGGEYECYGVMSIKIEMKQIHERE